MFIHGVAAVGYNFAIDRFVGLHTEGRIGVEAYRHSSGAVSPFVGIDVGLERSRNSDVEAPAEIAYFGPLLVARGGLDCGWDRVRFRLALEARAGWDDHLIGGVGVDVGTAVRF